MCGRRRLSDKIKYWIKPDLENRIKEGSIRAHFNTAIAGNSRVIARRRTSDGVTEIDNDWVIAMTGYHPDYAFLETLNIGIQTTSIGRRSFDETTFETTRPGVYIAGTVCGGYQTSRWFIENGRFHAQQIARHIAGGRPSGLRSRPSTGRPRSDGL